MYQSSYVESRVRCQVSPTSLCFVPLRLNVELPFFSEAGSQQDPAMLSQFSILELEGCKGPQPALPGCWVLNTGPHAWAANAPPAELPPSCWLINHILMREYFCHMYATCLGSCTFPSTGKMVSTFLLHILAI